MRIAFYAPMKPPGAAVPSGDRAMARLLIRALEHAGHDVEVAAGFSSRDPVGDESRQTKLRAIGERLARRLARRYGARARAARPDLWFTYHLYYKAPDWIGPTVADRLSIPYVVAEASHAPKRATGKWRIGHDGAEAAIRRADALIGLNSHDGACVRPLLDRPCRLHGLAPFIDITPFTAAADGRERHHAELVARHGIDAKAPLLLAVAMMRDGDKLESYRVLAAALTRLEDEPWTLLVAGDGPARPEVERAFEGFPPERVRFLGTLDAAALPALYAAADIYVWPAVREAYGVAILEAQAAGLPVVAGDAGGVGDIVEDGKTGLLTKEGDAEAFAEAVRALLQAPYLTAAYASAARRKAAAEHTLEGAAARLDAILREVRAERCS